MSSPPCRVASDFHRVLRARVEAYFRDQKLSRRDAIGLYGKAVIVLAWFVLSYVLLLWFATAWWQALALAVSLGLSASAVGFNLQHDGGHRAFSCYKWINRTAAFTLDLLGGSSYVWHYKHNLRHHSYPNVDGLDDDIDVGILARFAPPQKKRRAQRYQHYYIWLLYPLLALKWQFLDDFRNLWTGRIGRHAFPRPGPVPLIMFLFGKLFMVWIFLLLPVMRHSIETVAPLFFVYSFSHGFTMAVIFQLGHCVEGVLFPECGGMRTASDWAYHQVRTSSNFAPHNRMLGWLIGGLNFQIEHHLFPGIAHTHYEALSPIVRQTCQEFGVHYELKPSLREALRSHQRWLRAMSL